MTEREEQTADTGRDGQVGERLRQLAHELSSHVLSAKLLTECLASHTKEKELIAKLSEALDAQAAAIRKVSELAKSITHGNGS